MKTVHRKSENQGEHDFIGSIIEGIIFSVIIAALFALPVRELWNWLMPKLFGLGEIEYLQAGGLIILARLLLGNFGGGGKYHSERETRFGRKFEKRLLEYAIGSEHKKWKDYDKFWKEEGEQVYKDFIERQKDNKDMKQ